MSGTGFSFSGEEIALAFAAVIERRKGDVKTFSQVLFQGLTDFFFEVLTIEKIAREGSVRSDYDAF